MATKTKKAKKLTVKQKLAKLKRGGLPIEYRKADGPKSFECTWRGFLIHVHYITDRECLAEMARQGYDPKARWEALFLAGDADIDAHAPTRDAAVMGLADHLVTLVNRGADAFAAERA